MRVVQALYDLGAKHDRVAQVIDQLGPVAEWPDGHLAIDVAPGAAYLLDLDHMRRPFACVQEAPGSARPGVSCRPARFASTATRPGDATPGRSDTTAR